MNAISAKLVCPECSFPIPEGAPDGLCPRCVLAGASTPTESGISQSGRADPPTVAEVAAAFPELEVLRLIGGGGMGHVFLVRQPALGRNAALKLLPRHLAADPSFAERFSREARTLARLNHPNIVGVYEFGQKGGFCYLMMEYVDGANLRQAMRAGRFTPIQALAVVPGICNALQYAHGEGVLHRDIKPENILLDTLGRVKIADFGIAKILGDTPGSLADITLTQSGVRLGTPHYMAPEQIEKPADVDHRADIYSLGVVFYELLTGELPLGRFPAPSEKAALDVRIDEIVFRALAKERAHRQQSAGEMRTQVEGLESGTTPRRMSGGGTTPGMDGSKPQMAGVPAPAGWAPGTLVMFFIPWVFTIVFMMVLQRNSLPASGVAAWIRILAILVGFAVTFTALWFWMRKRMVRPGVRMAALAAAVTLTVFLTVFWRPRILTGLPVPASRVMGGLLLPGARVSLQQRKVTEERVELGWEIRSDEARAVRLSFLNESFVAPLVQAKVGEFVGTVELVFERQNPNSVSMRSTINDESGPSLSRGLEAAATLAKAAASSGDMVLTMNAPVWLTHFGNDQVILELRKHSTVEASGPVSGGREMEPSREVVELEHKFAVNRLAEAEKKVQAGVIPPNGVEILDARVAVAITAAAMNKDPRAADEARLNHAEALLETTKAMSVAGKRTRAEVEEAELARDKARDNLRRKTKGILNPPDAPPQIQAGGTVQFNGAQPGSQELHLDDFADRRLSVIAREVVFDKWANRKRVQIRRLNGVTVTVNLEEIWKGRNGVEDVVLEDGDVVTVPKLLF